MKLLVIGAGGHAKVVIDAARCAGMEIAGVIGAANGASRLLGIPVSQDANAIQADGFIVAIGDNAERAHRYDECVADGMNAVSVIHPSAIIAEQVAIGAGTFVAAGVVINIDTRIGENAILNTGCVVDHDCEVADHTHLGPTASLCGGASIGTGTLIGTGAHFAPKTHVGKWSIVGAGAAVISNLPAHSVSVGVPARVIRRTESRVVT